MEKQTNQTSGNAAAVQTYRFDFGTDRDICTVSFKGVLPEQEICYILEAAGAHPYEGCGNAILSCLNAHQLAYSDFSFHQKQLEHPAVMTLIGNMLHDTSCGTIDQWIGSADAYYAVMDHQHQTGISYYEGCYFAMSRTPAKQGGRYEYHIIGQLFQCDTASGREQSYFAIRQDKDGHHLLTIDETDGEPVLATFGCVDMAKLLMHMENITTGQQVADLANR